LIGKKQGRITSWNFTVSQTVPPKRRSLVASFPKNSFWIKEELQPRSSQNPYNSSSMPVRFWEVPKEKLQPVLEWFEEEFLF
jgi:hypothetical protein